MSALRPKQVAGFGWRKDSPDSRDHQNEEAANHPRRGDLTVWPARKVLAPVPPVYDQLQLGSCTGNAIASLVQFRQMSQSETEGQNVPSRLFIYFGERLIENTVDQDAGAEIRDGMKVIASQGVPPESEWPYSDANPGPFQQKPPDNVYADAKKYEALEYFRNKQDEWDLKWLINNGYSFVFGFNVWDSFQATRWDQSDPPVMPVPDTTNESIQGGHAIECVGYDDSIPCSDGTHGAYWIKNSWNVAWGKAPPEITNSSGGGYFLMPYSYVHDTQQCSDFWSLRLVS